MALHPKSSPCTVVLHNDILSKEDVLCGSDVVQEGGIAYLTVPGSRGIYVQSKAFAPKPDEVSIHVVLARRFGFENRTKATLMPVKDIEGATGSHVELFIRDQHLSRADMWRINAQIDGTVLYTGQQLNYLGSPVAHINALYIGGQEVDSAYVEHPRTNLIFRSGSARFIFLIEVSQEMLEYWNCGDLMYELLTSGFLAELFQKWEELKVKHQVTVVLFGRRFVVEPLSSTSALERSSNEIQHQDFFHIVTEDMPSGDWLNLIQTIKKTFNGLSFNHQVSLATQGSMLEAINLAAMDLVEDNVDPHLATTGTNIVAITAGTGLFETNHQLLRGTTNLLMGNSVGVDIVCLSPKPLHPVPLFQYEWKDAVEYALPHWADVSYWRSPEKGHSAKWLFPGQAEDVLNIAIPALEGNLMKAEKLSISDVLELFDDEVFSRALNTADEDLEPLSRPIRVSLDTNEGEKDHRPLTGESNRTTTSSISQSRSPTSAFSPPPKTKQPETPKKSTQPPHPLMKTGRTISVGPKGLALSQGVASTTVSTHHAQHGKGIAGESIDSNSTLTSGIARQIRESLNRKPSKSCLVGQNQEDPFQTSKPMEIQIANEPKPDKNEIDGEADPASVVEKAMMHNSGSHDALGDDSLSATPKASISLAIHHRDKSDDQAAALSPWLTLLNPCNPRRDNMVVASEYRQWQNIFPRAVSSSSFKWDSLCSPAILPLQNEHRKSLNELDRHFSKKVRRLLTTGVDVDRAMREMISLRLSAGFQIIPVRRLRTAQMPSESIERMLLSLGDQYHELRALSDDEVQVTEYERTVPNLDESPGIETEDDYSIKLRPYPSRREQTVEVSLGRNGSSTDWSKLDDQAVNLNALLGTGGYFQMRFVLIPVEFSQQESQKHTRELSDEEKRLDGIQRLTQTWQRNRYFAAEDQRHQQSMIKSRTSAAADRDPNPLTIEYQTRDPSAVISMYGMSLAGQLTNGEMPALFSESDRFHTSDWDLVRLVKQLQEPPPAGVEMRDRRWFTRMHLNCFRGDELTNWLLRVFKDLETREDAVELGNQLMDLEVFNHVRGKHEFRDGNYFYQIKSAYRTTDYPDFASLFTKGIGRSMPATPLSEIKNSPTVRAAHGDSSPSSKGTPTPTLVPVDRKEKKELLLSEVLQYNVDPAKRSDQFEIVNLHYDRIHNPDNCYHIQLDWTSATPRLICESVTRWSSLVDGHGLKLVQVPLKEAGKLHQQHPFDRPIALKLVARPPDKVPATPHLDPNPSSPRSGDDTTIHHKEILRKAGFVLDLEAASSFPRRLDVAYSWGPLEYEHTQFIHRSGLVLAQISKDSNHDFLLLLNRLASQSTSTTNKKIETLSSGQIVRDFRSFCSDEQALKAIYEEMDKPKVSPATPLRKAAVVADNDVPPIELPPHLINKSQREGGMI